MTRQTVMRNVGPISVTSNTLPKIDVLEYSTNIAHAVLYCIYIGIEARLEWIETIIHSQVVDVYFIRAHGPRASVKCML